MSHSGPKRATDPEPAKCLCASVLWEMVDREAVEGDVVVIGRRQGECAVQMWRSGRCSGIGRPPMTGGWADPRWPSVAHRSVDSRETPERGFLKGELHKRGLCRCT